MDDATKLEIARSITPKKAWQAYSGTVYPSVKPGSIEYKELEQAFMAGMFETMNLIMLFTDVLSDGEAAVKMAQFMKETSDFCENRIEELRSNGKNELHKSGH